MASGFLEVGKASAAQRGKPLGAPKEAAGDTGTALQAPLADDEGSFDKGAYFIGKAVWGKGHGTLLQRMKEARDAGSSFHLDCFGSGEDEEEVPSLFFLHCRCLLAITGADELKHAQSSCLACLEAARWAAEGLWR